MPPGSNDDTVVIPAQPPPQMGYLPPPNQELQPPQVRIENMSCIHGIHFRATFRITNELSSNPVVDESVDNCIVQMSGNTLKIELEDYNKMVKCGVRSCRRNIGNSTASLDNMCVMIRIPTVTGVRLPEDKIVTLMCTPQEKVVSQTKHVKLGSRKIHHISKARSNNEIVATGGTQNDLKTRIGIFRKRPGSSSFDDTVYTDTIIELGEELLLRAVISEVDGWENSQIGPVLITGLNSKKSALLVNEQSCVNPVIRSICPKQPVKINPLITELTFRAFLFQESPQGDEMVLSVRMQGCVQAQDCRKSSSCGKESHSRSKREFPTSRPENLSIKESGEQIENWESQISFKVKPIPIERSNSNGNKSGENETVIFISAFLVGLSISLVVLLWLVGRMYCLSRDKNII